MAARASPGHASSIDREEFAGAVSRLLSDHAGNIDRQEFSNSVRGQLTDNRGSIDRQEFVDAVRGQLSDLPSEPREAPRSSPGSPRGSEIDEWEVDPATIHLKEKIGSGCTAEVFRALMPDRSTGNMMEVAVKQIDFCKKKMDAKQQCAFDREMSIMPKLNHDNLVKFLGVASRSIPFRIITEFCAGGCCFELLHNCDDVDLSWKQTLKMCVDVAAGMNYLHQYHPQIIHRDLKSLNLLLSHPVDDSHTIPLVKVSDFGLSRMKEQAGEHSDWGKMTIAAGTCHWMAPEVLMGPSYDEKVDVYSYAMILFEIICREIPFEEEEPAEVGIMTVRGLRPDLEAVPPDCPALLRQLMICCWAHDPQERPDFQRIEDILASIQFPRARPG